MEQTLYVWHAALGALSMGFLVPLGHVLARMNFKSPRALRFNYLFMTSSYFMVMAAYAIGIYAMPLDIALPTLYDTPHAFASYATAVVMTMEAALGFSYGRLKSDLGRRCVKGIMIVLSPVTVLLGWTAITLGLLECLKNAKSACLVKSLLSAWSVYLFFATLLIGAFEVKRGQIIAD